VGGWERIRRGDGFSSFMEPKIKGKIALSFASPEKDFFLYL
jgi:hypothetical protein